MAYGKNNKEGSMVGAVWEGWKLGEEAEMFKENQITEGFGSIV